MQLSRIALACLAVGGRLQFESRDASVDASDALLANHDEDGDGIDDAIDPCPVVPLAGNADPDGDGVGASCDPNLSPAGDEIPRSHSEPAEADRLGIDRPAGAELSYFCELNDNQGPRDLASSPTTASMATSSSTRYRSAAPSIPGEGSSRWT